METLINIVTMIGIAYLVVIIFAFIAAIAMSIVLFKFFRKQWKDMAEMEKRHDEMRERFSQRRTKHQIEL